MKFSYKKTKRRRPEYHLEVSPFLVDDEVARKLEEKLVEPKHRAKNFRQGIKKAVKK